MKVCPQCGGRGFELLMDRFGYLRKKACDKCGGSGVAEPMTNEEYIRTCTTEQLAEFISTQCADAIRLWREMQYWTAHEKCKSDKWYVWLKEIHNEMQIE